MFCCKNGHEIWGTLERVSARCTVEICREPDGSLAWEHDGVETEIFYDEMKTVERDGEPVFLCRSGCETKLSEIVEKADAEAA